MNLSLKKTTDCSLAYSCFNVTFVVKLIKSNHVSMIFSRHTEHIEAKAGTTTKRGRDEIIRMTGKAAR